MNGPEKFRKKPVEVDAIQWTGKNPAAVRAFTGMHHLENGGEHFVFTTQSGHGELFVAANGAWLDIEVGEWIIRDARGFYPCKPDIFEQTYVPLDKRGYAAGGYIPPMPALPRPAGQTPEGEPYWTREQVQAIGPAARAVLEAARAALTTARHLHE